MNTVKVGDRVRVTCGESVIVGTVSCVWGTSVDVTPDGSTRINCFRFDTWTVEVLPPPIPDVVGTIIRDVLGHAWQLTSHGWHQIKRDTWYPFNYMQLNYGPLTVLWTPGDAT